MLQIMWVRLLYGGFEISSLKVNFATLWKPSWISQSPNFSLFSPASELTYHFVCRQVVKGTLNRTITPRVRRSCFGLISSTQILRTWPQREPPSNGYLDQFDLLGDRLFCPCTFCAYTSPVLMWFLCSFPTFPWEEAWEEQRPHSSCVTLLHCSDMISKVKRIQKRCSWGRKRYFIS